MKTKTTLWAVIVIGVAVIAPASAVETVYTEDFEDTTATYSLADVNGNAVSELNSPPDDFFGRAAVAEVHVDDGGDNLHSGAGGSFIFAAEDAETGGGTLPFSLTSDSFSVLGSNTITVSGLFAAGASGAPIMRYEDDDWLRVHIDFDGADTFATQLLGFEVPIKPQPSPAQNIFEDTDLDGIGDGTLLTDAFQTFSETIATPGGAASARIRITLDTSSTSEEFAFDNLMVEVDQLIPEPWTVSLLGLCLAGMLMRRERSRR